MQVYPPSPLSQVPPAAELSLPVTSTAIPPTLEPMQLTLPSFTVSEEEPAPAEPHLPEPPVAEATAPDPAPAVVELKEQAVAPAVEVTTQLFNAIDLEMELAPASEEPLSALPAGESAAAPAPPPPPPAAASRTGLASPGYFDPLPAEQMEEFACGFGAVSPHFEVRRKYSSSALKLSERHIQVHYPPLSADPLCRGQPPALGRSKLKRLPARCMRVVPGRALRRPCRLPRRRPHCGGGCGRLRVLQKGGRHHPQPYRI